MSMAFFSSLTFMTGIKTNAPEITIITTNGPSILGEEVSTKKQSAAQSKVNATGFIPELNRDSHFSSVLDNRLLKVYKGI